MPALTCFRLHPAVGGEPVSTLDAYVDPDVLPSVRHGPVTTPGFEALLIVSESRRRPASWAAFLQQGFSEVVVPETESLGAVVIVRIGDGFNQCFAFTFGVLGRHLLRDDAWVRSYGLRTALNLIYPSGTGPTALSRLVAVDTKRRSAATVRARRQATRSTTLETFELDRLRDAVTAATGRPVDERVWGLRITGGDAVAFGTDSEWDGLGRICRALDVAHARTDYREHFAWLDHFQPVADPFTRGRLESEVADRLRSGRLTTLDLAPPDVVDWSRLDNFQLPEDGRRHEKHPDLRLKDLIGMLTRTKKLAAVDPAFLRTRRIRALDADGATVASWPVWKCLFGEVRIGSDLYVLDEGEFFRIEQSYLREVDGFVSAVPLSSVALPLARPAMREQEYNEAAAHQLDALLMDRQAVRSSSSTTPVEVCDILTQSRQLIHVKRHLGSSDLSHLSSQGFVSADLLQSDGDFRQATHRATLKLGGGKRFGFFGGAGIVPAEFEVVFAVIAHWRGRSAAKALPFFSKINLRSRAQELTNRGFKVSFAQIGVSG